MPKIIFYSNKFINGKFINNEDLIGNLDIGRYLEDV